MNVLEYLRSRLRSPKPRSVTPSRSANAWWQSIYFHHIGKTAGTSYRKLLESLVEPHEVFPYYWLERSVVEANFRKFRLYRGHFPFVFSRLLPQPSAIVTTLREPRAHFLSGYNHLKRLGGRHIALAHRASPLASIEDLLNDTVLRRLCTNTQSFSLGWDPPLRSILLASQQISDADVNNTSSPNLDSLQYVHYGEPDCCRESGELLEMAIHRLLRECVAFGIAEESYELDSLRQISSSLGLTMEFAAMPKENCAVDQSDGVVTWSDLSRDQQADIDSLTHSDRQLYRIAIENLNAVREHVVTDSNQTANSERDRA